MRGQPAVYAALERLGINWEEAEHDPVFTIEDMRELPFPPDAVTAKNLFLRDAKGRRHILAVLDPASRTDLRLLQEELGCSRLSFGSAERLQRCLGLTPGAVSPFGILNDRENMTELVLDTRLREHRRLGVHPNVNTATVFVTAEDIVRMAEAHGTAVRWVTFGSS